MNIAKPCASTLLLVACAGVLAACGSSANGSGTASSTSSATPRASIAAAGSLPLGDGRLSSSPRVGYLDSCQQKFPPGAPGAVAKVPWIHGASWDPSQKIVVQGKVRWPQARITITVRGKTRVIQTRDLPVGATTGTFPISPSSAAYRFDRNPNKIIPHDDIFELPRNPAPARQPGCLGSGPIGLFTNGVLLFDALDEGGRDAVAHEIQDSCDGHPAMGGIYHYHSVSACLLAKATGPSTLVGYAADGYGIYVERNADGKLLTDAELDACHGRVSPVLWNGRRVRIYHYDATAEYPYTIGCFRGHSIIKQRALTGPPPGGPPPPPAPAS
jgi:YHYH protein